MFGKNFKTIFGNANYKKRCKTSFEYMFENVSRNIFGNRFSETYMDLMLEMISIRFPKLTFSKLSSKLISEIVLIINQEL